MVEDHVSARFTSTSLDELYLHVCRGMHEVSKRCEYPADTDSDSAAKQILLHVDSGLDGSRKFVLRDGEISYLSLWYAFY